MLLKILCPRAKNNCFTFKQHHFLVSFPFFSQAAARTICLLKEINFVLRCVQFPFSSKMLFLMTLFLNMLSVRRFMLNSFRFC